MTEQLLTEEELFLHTISHKRRLANFFKQHPNGLTLLKTLRSKLSELEVEVDDHFQTLNKQRAEIERAKVKVAEQVEALLSTNNLTKEQLFSTLNQASCSKDGNKRDSNKKPFDITEYKYIYKHDGVTEVWKGSAGRKPQWVTRFQDAGVDIEQYRNPLYKGRGES